MIHSARGFLQREISKGLVLNEDTVPEVMVKFTELQKRISWLVCPKCLGQGIVYYPIGIPFNVLNCGTSAKPFECDVCKGKKIINHEGNPPK